MLDPSTIGATAIPTVPVCALNPSELNSRNGLEDGEIIPSPATKERLRVPSPPEEGSDGFTLVTKRKRKKTKSSGLPGYYDIYGGEACASAEIKSTMVRLQDLQNLLLWVLGEAINPQWVFLKNKPLIRRVVMVMAHGLEQKLYNSKKELLSNLTNDLGSPAVVIAQNATVHPGRTMATLFTVPRTRKRKREEDQQQQGMPSKSCSRSALLPGPSYYKMSLQEMQERNYPLPVVDEQGVMRCPEGWVATQPAADPCSVVTDCMMALDCEMCITAEGLELTRATLVNAQGEVLLDELVLPRSPIEDYNTRYSGITAEMLANVTTRLEDVQRKVLDIVNAETLLVGHSLENDLLAMRIIHANVIDTSCIYPHPKGPPHRPALRILASRFLRRQIQRVSHDSIDDAKATMELALLKIKHGPNFGIPNNERGGDKLTAVLTEHNRRSAIVDRQQHLHRMVAGNCSAIAINSDEEAVEKVCKEATNEHNHFVWTQLTGLWSIYEQRAGLHETRSGDPEGSCAAASTSDWQQQLDIRLLDIDRQCHQIFESLPHNTLMIVATGQGDTMEVRRLQDEKHSRQRSSDPDAPPWTLQDENKLTAEADRAVRALCFCAVKQTKPVE